MHLETWGRGFRWVVRRVKPQTNTRGRARSIAIRLPIRRRFLLREAGCQGLRRKATLGSDGAFGYGGHAVVPEKPWTLEVPGERKGAVIPPNSLGGYTDPLNPARHM